MISVGIDVSKEKSTICILKPYGEIVSRPFTGTERKISKRGSSSLRKIGYEVMRCLKTHKAPEDASVYEFILKKEKEGKSKRAAKIAGLNKFLRIYYARVMEVYEQ